MRRTVTAALQDVMADPGRGPVVLKVPPGLGKTTTLSQALLSWPGHPLKVLWFLRASRLRAAGEPTSPVTEVLQLFPCPLANAEVIEGGQPSSGQAAYVRDRGLAQDLPKLQVRLLAHAYLPWVFGASDRPSWASSFSGDADLVVIDEDPPDVLVATQDDLPVPLPWPLLLTLMQESGVLQDGPDQIPVSPPREKRGVPTAPARGGRPQDSRLASGKSRVQSDAEHHKWLAAWAAALNPDLPPHRWNDFRQRLTEHMLALLPGPDGQRRSWAPRRQAARRLLFQVTDELRRELLTVGQGIPATRRFGLIWTPAPAGGVPAEQVHLHFSLPRTLRFTRPGNDGGPVRPVPVLILDAYAHQERYKRTLKATTRTVLTEARFQLDVETYTSAGHVSPLSLKRGAGRRHLVRLILEAVLSGLSAQGTLDRSLLLLAPGDVTGTLKGNVGAGSPESPEHARQLAVRLALPWLTELFSPAGGENLKVEAQHWFAGRGVNRYTGWDVVALTRPRSPRAAQDRLAAHLPDATPAGAAERHQLWRYDQDAELLQLLNRGRQVRCREEARPVPRVMTLFPLNAPDDVHHLLQGSVRIRSQRAAFKRGRHTFEHRQLAGLRLAPGRLELTKLVATAIAMELLHRPPAVGLPSGWFPEEVFSVLGLLSPGPAGPPALTEAFFRAVHLEELASAFRFTASAWKHSAAGTGLWSPLTGGTAPWLPPGSPRYFRQEVLSVLRDHLNVSPHRVLVKGLGWIWTLEESGGPAIFAWFRSVQDQGDHASERRGAE